MPTYRSTFQEDLFESTNPDQVILDRLLLPGLSLEVKGIVSECFINGEFVGKIRISYLDDIEVYVTNRDILKPEWRAKFVEVPDTFLWNLFFLVPGEGKNTGWYSVLSLPRDIENISEGLRKEYWKAVFRAVKFPDWMWGSYGTEVDLYFKGTEGMVKDKTVFLVGWINVAKNIICAP